MARVHEGRAARQARRRHQRRRAIAVVVVAILAVGREGLETALFLWVGAQAARTTSAAPLLGAVLGLRPRSSRLRVLPGRLKLNLRVFFAWTGVPDRRRRRRPRLRRPRPPGGRHPARPQQPRLRRLGHDPAGQLARHDPQGHLQLLARDDLAPGRRLGRLHRPGPDLFFSSGSGAAARRRVAAAPRPPGRRPTPPDPGEPTLLPPSRHRARCPARAHARRLLAPARSSPAAGRVANAPAAAPAARSRSTSTTKECEVSAHLGPVGRPSRSRSRTTATRSPSSTCSRRTACGSSARSRTSARG